MGATLNVVINLVHSEFEYYLVFAHIDAEFCFFKFT